jgi:hypothetical protein
VIFVHVDLEFIVVVFLFGGSGGAGEGNSLEREGRKLGGLLE